MRIHALACVHAHWGQRRPLKAARLRSQIVQILNDATQHYGIINIMTLFIEFNDEPATCDGDVFMTKLMRDVIAFMCRRHAETLWKTMSDFIAVAVFIVGLTSGISETNYDMACHYSSSSG